MTTGKFFILWLAILLILADRAECARPFPSPVTDTFRLKNQVIPAALIITGISINSHDIKEKLQAAFPRTETNADDYFQWTPAGIMYVSDMFTNKHRNSVFNQTKYLLISEVATSLITQFLKKATWITRPNGGTRSFPSGHTSNAFTTATVLFHEYRDYNITIAASGYIFSTATGILRVTNNRHWVPDVLAGAGIGIIVTNLVYWWEPLKKWDPFGEKLDKVTILPQIDAAGGNFSVGLNINF